MIPLTKDEKKIHCKPKKKCFICKKDLVLMTIKNTLK